MDRARIASQAARQRPTMDDPPGAADHRRTGRWSP